MAYNYAYQNFDKKNQARACSVAAQISLKKSVEVAKAICGKSLKQVIVYLENVVGEKQVVPYRKYRAEMAHKKGTGVDTGGYPVMVAKEFLRVIKAAEKNAKEQELGENLVLVSVSARKAQTRYHYGRHSGRQMKSTTLEVIVGVKKSTGGKKE